MFIVAGREDVVTRHKLDSSNMSIGSSIRNGLRSPGVMSCICAVRDLEIKLITGTSRPCFKLRVLCESISNGFSYIEF